MFHVKPALSRNDGAGLPGGRNQGVLLGPLAMEDIGDHGRATSLTSRGRHTQDVGTRPDMLVDGKCSRFQARS
jgi:hypothetical protein